MGRHRPAARRRTAPAGSGPGLPQGRQRQGPHKLLKARPYPSAEGALFAAHTGRSLLGDERGLGKTVQAIAAGEQAARHFCVLRVLLVCPTSPKPQWKAELAKFAGRPVQFIHCQRALRQDLYGQGQSCRIVNCEMLAHDADLIAARAPDLVVAG